MILLHYSNYLYLDLKDQITFKILLYFMYTITWYYSGTCRFGQLLGINPRISEVYHIEIHIQFG